MATVDTAVADKDQLLEFARTEYKVVIDPRTKIETIRERVQGLIDGVPADIIASDVTKPEASVVRYVKSAVNGNVYEYHEYLVGSDFIPCTADGVIV